MTTALVANPDVPDIVATWLNVPATGWSSVQRFAVSFHRIQESVESAALAQRDLLPVAPSPMSVVFESECTCALAQVLSVLPRLFSSEAVIVVPAVAEGVME